MHIYAVLRVKLVLYNMELCWLYYYCRRGYALNCYFAHVAVELIFVLSGIKRKLTNWAKMRGHDDLQGWMKSITNHLYWTVTFSVERVSRLAAFTGMFNHITDVNVHESDVFPGCLHPESSINWIIAG